MDQQPDTAVPNLGDATERGGINPCQHGPNEPCTCDGCWGCSGRVVGCTCDIDWAALAEQRIGRQ